MTDYIQLLGAEDVARAGSSMQSAAGDVARAGSSMQSAAEDMQRAASVIEESLRLHQMFLDDWLNHFETIMKGEGDDEPTEAG